MLMSVHTQTHMHARTESADDGTEPCDQSHMYNTKSGGFLCSLIGSDDYCVVSSAGADHTTTVSRRKGDECERERRRRDR